MARIIVGAVVAAVAMFIIGFIFCASGLQNIAAGSVGDPAAASVQQVLAANIPATGTYHVPSPDASAGQTVLYGQGPIATIHYNLGGFASTGIGSLLGALVIHFLVAMVIGLGFVGIGPRVPDFGARARLAVSFAVAASALTHLTKPIYFHFGWGHFIYLFIADAVALAAAGLIIAWFLPRVRDAGAATTMPG